MWLFTELGGDTSNCAIVYEVVWDEKLEVLW
jgi:hypothetical protein